jgi:hypothetical protein
MTRSELIGAGGGLVVRGSWLQCKGGGWALGWAGTKEGRKEGGREGRRTGGGVAFMAPTNPSPLHLRRDGTARQADDLIPSSSSPRRRDRSPRLAHHLSGDRPRHLPCRRVRVAAV